MSWQSSQILSQDEPFLELQVTTCLLPPTRHLLLLQGNTKAKSPVWSELSFCLCIYLFSNWAVLQNNSEIVMLSGHMGRADENSSSGAGKRPLGALQPDTESVVWKYHQLICLAHQLMLIPLSGLHNSPPSNLRLTHFLLKPPPNISLRTIGLLKTFKEEKSADVWLLGVCFWKSLSSGIQIWKGNADMQDQS